MNERRWGDAILSGLAGATAVTVVHETARKLVPDAPRMDILGKRALRKGMRQIGIEPPRGADMERASLAGELVANTIYYGLLGALPSRRPLLHGALLGTLAGLGSVTLPHVLGIQRHPVKGHVKTGAMAFTWYLLGGLAAALAWDCLRRTED